MTFSREYALRKLDRPERDQSILHAAGTIIRTQGLSSLTRDALAKATGLSAGSVSNFGLSSIQNSPNPSTGFRARVLSALMDDAIAAKDVALIRVGLVDGCLKAADVPAALREVMGR